MAKKETILDKILVNKRYEVSQRRDRVPFTELRAQLRDLSPALHFEEALRNPRNGRIALIAEVKKASPSAGVIRADFEPVEIARCYADHGADCLSVLTDKRFFHGHDTYLTSIKQAIAIPALRKDFVIDPYQLYEARALGADAILLIVSALTPTQVADYTNIARELGMAALVETHTEREMEIALEARSTLIGINNRDLSSFVTDLGTFERLAKLAPREATLVAESGIKSPADIQRLHAAGAHAILVGETLMRAPDIGAAVRELMEAGTGIDQSAADRSESAQP